MVGHRRHTILYDTTYGPPSGEAPLPRSALRSTIRRMRSIGGGACTDREHKNWSSTYVIMKICGKALGVSWWMKPLGRSLEYSWSPLGEYWRSPSGFPSGYALGKSYFIRRFFSFLFLITYWTNAFGTVWMYEQFRIILFKKLHPNMTHCCEALKSMLSIYLKKNLQITFWETWRIQIQINPKNSIEPKYGEFYLKKKVRVWLLCAKLWTVISCKRSFLNCNFCFRIVQHHVSHSINSH